MNKRNIWKAVWTAAVLGSFSLAIALALSISWSQDGTGSVQAQEGQSRPPVLGGPAGGPGYKPVDFSIFAQGEDIDGQSDFCDTNGIDKKCRINPGASFTVIVVLKDIAGLLQSSPAGYHGLMATLDYSWNLTVKKPPEAIWPDCLPGPLGPAGEGQGAGIGPGLGWYDASPFTNEFQVWCAIDKSAQPPSGYVGAVFGVTFNCPDFNSKETVTLRHGPFFTSVLDVNQQPWYEFNAVETIVINCEHYFPWDVHGPQQSQALDGVVTLQDDILGTILHFMWDKETGPPPPP